MSNVVVPDDVALELVRNADQWWERGFELLVTGLTGAELRVALDAIQVADLVSDAARNDIRPQMDLVEAMSRKAAGQWLTGLAVNGNMET